MEARVMEAQVMEAKPEVREIEQTLEKMRETLAAFDAADEDLKANPQAAEVFANLRREMERMEKNLKTLKRNMQ